MSDDSTKTHKKEPLNTKDVVSLPKKDFGHPLKVIILSLVVFFASQFLAAIIIGLVLAITRGANSVDTFFEDSIAGNLALILFAELLTFFFVYKLVGSDRAGLKKIGLIKPRLKDVPYAAIGFLAFYAILFVVSIIVYNLIPSINTDQKQELGFDSASTDLELIITFISLVILPPLGEEILMRGYMFSGLRYRLRYWPSALIVSGLFSMAHLQIGNGDTPLWAAAINTFVLSMVLVYLREKSGSLWPAIYVHALNNLIAFVYLFKDKLF